MGSRNENAQVEEFGAVRANTGDLQAIKVKVREEKGMKKLESKNWEAEIRMRR